MKKVNTVYPTQEQLVELYDIIFGYTHSSGFKESEVKDFLFDDEYCINYEKQLFRINIFFVLNNFLRLSI